MRELFQGQEVSISGDDVAIEALVYDSRKAKPGSLFAAFQGISSDGHAFIPKAIENGATAILCEREVDTQGATRIVAPDGRKALALAAKAFFANPSQSLKTVGITGTNGKTTTAHLLAEIFKAAQISPGVVGTLGVSYNGKQFETGLTTPESVDLVNYLREMADDGVGAVVMEVSSHALVQHRAAGVEFDVGIFTNLTQDHLDYHDSLEDYFEAKAQLFRTHLKSGGVGVINLDDSKVATLRSEATLGFSMKPDSDAEIKLLSQKLGARGTHLKIETPQGECEIQSQLVGDFNSQNMLAAVGAGIALGFCVETISEGLQSIRAVPGRLEKVNGAGHDKLPLVLVDYAHTPDALEKALGAVRSITEGRLICVFGCGGDRDPTKRAPMGRAATLNSDWALLTSDNPRTEDPQKIADAVIVGLEAAGACRGGLENRRAYEVELDRSVAIATAIKNASVADCILIAGKGHEDYQIIGTVKRSFDDRKEALKVLEKLRE